MYWRKQRKYKTFSIPIKKKIIKIDKNGNKTVKAMYILQNKIR